MDSDGLYYFSPIRDDSGMIRVVSLNSETGDVYLSKRSFRDEDLALAYADELGGEMIKGAKLNLGSWDLKKISRATEK